MEIKIAGEFIEGSPSHAHAVAMLAGIVKTAENGDVITVEDFEMLRQGKRLLSERWQKSKCVYMDIKVVYFNRIVADSDSVEWHHAADGRIQTLILQAADMGEIIARCGWMVPQELRMVVGPPLPLRGSVKWELDRLNALSDEERPYTDCSNPQEALAWWRHRVQKDEPSCGPTPDQ